VITPFVLPDPGAPRYFDVIGSPIGQLLLTGSDDALTGLYMMNAPHGLPAGLPAAGAVRDPGAFTKTEAQLAAYFAGDLTGFDVPLAPAGRPFQLAVWSALTGIPYGMTTSYGAIARQRGQRAEPHRGDRALPPRHRGRRRPDRLRGRPRPQGMAASPGRRPCDGGQRRDTVVTSLVKRAPLD
jgi:hypothetical protein